MKRLVCIVVIILLLMGCSAPATNKQVETAGGQRTPESADASTKLEVTAASIPERRFAANELSELYETDNDAAKSFEGKIIEITGVVTNTSKTRITIDRETKYGFYMCEMQSGEDISAVKDKDMVTILGILKSELGNIYVEECCLISRAEPTPVPTARIENDGLRTALDSIIEVSEGVIVEIDSAPGSNWNIVRVIVSDAWYDAQEYEKERFAETVGEAVKTAVSVNSSYKSDDVYIDYYDTFDKCVASYKLLGGYKIER